MPNTRLRRIHLTSAGSGETDSVLEHIPVGEEQAQAHHLQVLGATVGRRLGVRIDSVAGETLVDRPAPEG